MKIIQTKVFEFNELSDKAKEKARDWMRQCNASEPDPWATENLESMEKFADLFPIEIKDWSYGGCNGGDGVTFVMTEGNVEGLTGLRLNRWLMNNVHHLIYKEKCYSTPGQYVNGKYTYKFRHSKSELESCCPLTGYCMDDTLLDPIRKFMSRPVEGATLRDLLEDSFHAWVTACVNEREYQDSEEAIDESMSANQYTFTVDGKREG